MRIVNTSGTPLYLSYGTKTKGGITLEPNAYTNEVPIETMHHPQLWKDVASNKVQFILSELDHAFLKKVIDCSGQPIRVVEAKVRVPAPRPPVNVKQTAPAAAIRTTTPFQGKFGSPLSNAVNRQAGVQQLNAMSEVAMGAPKSLKEVQRMNAAAK